MSDLSVAEAAGLLGLSRQRVNQLIRDGQLEAHRVGRSWSIPEAALKAHQASRRPGVRPMSPRVARAMVDLMGQHLGEEPGPSWGELPHRERSRLRQRWQQLAASRHPASLLRAWLPRRCRAQRFSYQGEAQDLFADSRLRSGGVAHPALGLAGGSLVEPHVADVDRERVIWDLLLVPDSGGNVLLRSEPVVRVDLAACLVDVAELGGGRNDKVVADVLAQEVRR
ncbi:helix-turn-helix domain-containing protein [Ornithinimicrobium cavernae]|uniref:helix-turn-helix domain-containing protein n=1 Tax=Ornithinimicrobium cavernae TaxID=2666047 RepID=UPI000D6938AA|nr:helix-turn-helix domain-containing protein [Ornithinimicrobium cavernae]